MMTQTNTSKADEAEKTWQMLDVDGDGKHRAYFDPLKSCVHALGSITREEFQKGLQSIGVRITPWEVLN